MLLQWVKTHTAAVVMRDAEGNSKHFGLAKFESTEDAAKAVDGLNGNSKRFGLAKFESAEDAAKAVDGLNGQKFDDKEGCVGKAQKKGGNGTGSEAEILADFKGGYVDKSQQLNLYIKNLDDTISDEGLNEFFAPFDTITSCKVCQS